MDNFARSLRRRPLQITVAALLDEVGFDKVNKMALETLVELTQNFIHQCGVSSKSYCELTGRTEPILTDVILALANMGINVDGIEMHATRPYRTVFPPLPPTIKSKQVGVLSVGVRQQLPPHIPPYYPPFPDPHTYIRTPTNRKPITDHESIRKKAAIQKRDIEGALLRFVAGTSETDSIFCAKSKLFPLIACKPQLQPYREALLLSDQVLQNESPSSSSFTNITGPDSNVGEAERLEQMEEIDNPYLRPAKMPRKRRSRRTQVRGKYSKSKSVLN